MQRSNETMATTSSTQAQARPARFTVLLVEADPPDARLTPDWLTHEGARGPIVLGATSVTEARAVLAACRVDCIVLDLGVPDASGLEALTAMVRAAPGVPVVVLTARDDDAIDLRLAHVGDAEVIAETHQAVRRRAGSDPAGPGLPPRGRAGDLRGSGSR